MISALLSLVCAGLVAFAPGAWAGEKLAYAVVYKGSDYSAVKTEILFIDPDTAEKQLVFSDEKTPIVLLQHLYVFHFPVVGGQKLFAHAAERGKSLPYPGNGSLYELSTDGANSFRRISQVLGDGSLGDIFVNSTGTRVGYLNGMNRRQYLFIHDVETGKLLHQIDITDTFLDCFASSIGWLPGSEKLYFSLETGDEHITSEASYVRVGTYFMDERSGDLTKLPRTPDPRRVSFARDGTHDRSLAERRIPLRNDATHEPPAPGVPRRRAESEKRLLGGRGHNLQHSNQAVSRNTGMLQTLDVGEAPGRCQLAGFGLSVLMGYLVEGPAGRQGEKDPIAPNRRAQRSFSGTCRLA